MGARWPILAVLGDQQAALYGHGAFEAGQTKCTYGTGAFVLKHRLDSATLPRRPPHHRSVARGGAAPRLRLGSGYLQRRRRPPMAGKAGTPCRLPGTGQPLKAAPTKSSSCRPSQGWARLAGTLTPEGLSSGWNGIPTAKPLLLAALEAIAYQTADALELFGDISELRVDGGVSQNDLLMQLQADLTGRRVLRPAHGEVTAWGAAALAGRQAGLPVQPSRPSPTGNPAPGPTPWTRREARHASPLGSPHP